MVGAVVRRWLDSHPAEVERIGSWTVFEGESSLDLVVRIHRVDGVRELALKDQQVQAVPEHRIVGWLDNLPSQPIFAYST
jgi:hypothetical protein